MMEQTIKPIETIYNGYRFRSRLEARWAVFFDALNIQCLYETEGEELKPIQAALIKARQARFEHGERP